MSVIPERPHTSDSATRAHREYCREIDYRKSSLHGEAMSRLNSIKLKKIKTSSVEGIIEQGEREEEDQKMNPYGSITLSNMNFMKSNFDVNSLQEKLSLSALECRYLVSILKNRSV